MEDEAYKYARNLLFEICRRDCPEKEVEALDDTIGVLTQIDHMTAHLFSRIEELIAARDAARDAALEEAAKVAAGRYRSHSQYSPESVFYGIDLTPDRSDWGRGVQRGREEAAAAIRALKGKSHE